MNKVLTIYIGYNYDGLNGAENDAKLMNNLNNSILLLNKNATLNNVEKALINNKNKFDKLLIFFSGHGYPGGLLKFYDKIIRPIDLYESINRSVYNHIDLIFILDCCYSGAFTIINNFQKIKKTKLLSACNSTQKTIEQSVKITNYNLSNINNSKNVIFGTYTFNLFEFLVKNNYTLYDLFFIDTSQINFIKKI
jgi:hypothetical protein